MPVDLDTQRIVFTDERDAEMQRQLRTKRAEGMTWEQEQKFCDEWIFETEKMLLGNKFKTATLPDHKEPKEGRVSREGGDGSVASLADWVKLCGGTVHSEKQ